MKKMINPPFAPNLVESMRSIGYSFDTALADIVDNSIASGATRVDVISNAIGDDSYVSILDNGCGMNEEELFTAMKYGSINPTKERTNSDMGRFGLGLKSASLSQSRKLTVVSKKDNVYSAMVWDIDYIIESQDWSLQILDESEIKALPRFNKLDEYESGTLVLWNKLDRIKSTSSDTNEYLKELLVNSIDHFALIYHRLINNNFKIFVNGIEVVPRDPFLEKNKSTILQREQKVKIDGNTILVKPFILPHINKLSNDDIRKLGGKESLRTEQGFYIYRNKRLIIWGTWFRLGNKDELTKLARVRVDIPNSMDYLWDIDIKKSRASLPEKIKVNLYNAVMKSCSESEQVHIYRGRKVITDQSIHSWNVIEKRKGEGLGIEINLDNPLIKGFMDSLDDNQKRSFYSIVEDIEETVPLDYIYTKMAKGFATDKQYSNVDNETLYEEVKKKIEAFIGIGMNKKEIVNTLMNYERYANNEYIKNKLTEYENGGD